MARRSESIPEMLTKCPLVDWSNCIRRHLLQGSSGSPAPDGGRKQERVGLRRPHCGSEQTAGGSVFGSGRDFGPHVDVASDHGKSAIGQANGIRLHPGPELEGI